MSLFAVVVALTVPLQVSAAASLSEAVTEIAAAYEASSGNKVNLNFGASSILARQIELGAPVDIFLSADEAKVDALAKHALIGKRISILSNQLVVIGGPEIRKPADLLKVQRLALAEPSTVPAGIYAKQWLEKIGLWQKLAPKVIPTENVRGALAAVEVGNADAAIVYRTDARIAKSARVAIEVTGKDAPSISYSFAETIRAPHGHGFLTFLQSKRAKAIFVKHGFIVR